MDPGSWSVWLGGSGFAAALMLTATAMALSNLSGGVARKIELRDRDLAAVKRDLHLQVGEQCAHTRLGQLRSFLLDQPLPDPPGGVALLARRVHIGQ